MFDFDLLQFELITDSQRTTIGVALKIVAIGFVNSGQRVTSTQVEGNAVLELIRETNGNREIERFASIRRNTFLGIVANQETRLQTNLQGKTFANIEIGHEGNVDVVKLCSISILPLPTQLLVFQSCRKRKPVGRSVILCLSTNSETYASFISCYSTKTSVLTSESTYKRNQSMAGL